MYVIDGVRQHSFSRLLHNKHVP